MKQMKLNPGREKSLLRRHPWIFSGALATPLDEFEAGETVEVVDASGKPLAVAAASPESQLSARVWSFDPAEVIDEAFFAKRIAAAVARREMLGLNAPDGGCRIVFSESDGLPGVIADRFGNTVVTQLLSVGAEKWREVIAAKLLDLPGVDSVFERSDVGVRGKEKLPERTGLAAGAPPPNPILISENGIRYAVDVRHGQKTGFYLDQRDARQSVAAHAAGRRVLNAFCYTGGFGVAAAKAGATSVLNIDSSAPALALARHNFELNRIPADRFELREADCFEALRALVDAGEKFDLIVLDPPKFIDTRHVLPQGCRAYQDIARLGFKLLNPGGILFNFSCSGLMTPELFQKITADAAIEAGRTGNIIAHLSQAADHPVSLAVPETFYLKGLATLVD